MVTLNASCIEAIEVVDTKVGVGLPGAQNVVDGSEKAVRYGDGGVVTAATSGDSMELSVELTRLRLDASPGDLTHDGAQPDVCPGSSGLACACQRSPCSPGISRPTTQDGLRSGSDSCLRLSLPGLPRSRQP